MAPRNNGTHSSHLPNLEGYQSAFLLIRGTRSGKLAIPPDPTARRSKKAICVPLRRRTLRAFPNPTSQSCNGWGPRRAAPGRHA